MRKRKRLNLENKETEKPLGTWKVALAIVLPLLGVTITILVLSLLFGWIKYPFGF